jgi:hypothetical protein
MAQDADLGEIRYKFNGNKLDWSSVPPPWDLLGPEIAARLRALVGRRVFPPPPASVAGAQSSVAPTPPPPAFDPLRRAAAIDPLRTCPDCTWAGPRSEYKFHRYSDHHE